MVRLKEPPMTNISATSNYSTYYPTPTSSSTSASTASPSTSTGSSSSSATNVTLSGAALAAMNQPDFSTVVTQTRAALDALLINSTKPADADLSKLDRRQLFAISSNAQGKFTADEQAAAKTEQESRLDAALAGPFAVARVTDDIEGLYTAALAWLDGASTEEKATPAWTTQREALLEAQKQLAANPDKTPQVDDDIVADYVQRMTSGDDSSTPRDFDAVASDARTALDAQYSAAEAAGKTLSFGTLPDKNNAPVDFSKFDSRSLSAIALNQGDKFSTLEVFAAKQAMAQRSSKTILAGLNNAASDPATFAKNLISAYASMSAEERKAAGWSDQLYSAAVASYNTAANIANIFGDAIATSGTGALSILDGLDTSSDGSNMSLASVLNSNSGS
jgi:hypothetical protein